MNTTTLPTDDTSAAPARWTRLHIKLHWIAALLIAVQFLIGEQMAALFDATLAHESPGGTATVLGLVHIATGITVFFAVAARIWDRVANGRPPHPPGEPTWAQWLARVTQTLLYAIVFAMPLAGLIAWFTKNEWLGSMHALAAKALFVLLVLHVSGALANHYWFKTEVFRRMLPGHGRDEGGTRRGQATPR